MRYPSVFYVAIERARLLVRDTVALCMLFFGADIIFAREFHYYYLNGVPVKDMATCVAFCARLSGSGADVWVS